MSKNIKFLVHGGVLAALYVVLTYAQNLLWPGSTTMAIQMRLSEALCIFAFFTPAAIPGLTLGCLLYNVSWAQALPLDWLVGSLATLLATASMWGLRKVRLAKCPFLGHSLLYNGFYMLIDTLLCLVIFALLFRPMHQYLTGADLRKTTEQ